MRGRRRCSGCGEGAPASARFCGRCGVLLDASSRSPSSRSPSSADGSAGTPAGHGGAAARRGRWLVLVLLVAAVAVTSAVVAGDRLAEQADDEVALPDEEEIDEQQSTTPGDMPGPAMPDPEDIELTCLVDAPCERWRVEVAWLARDDPFMPVQEVAGGYVLHGPGGVVVLDPAGRERWRRTAADRLEITRAVAVDGDVLVMTSDGALRLLEGADGSTLWWHEEEAVVDDDLMLMGAGAQDGVLLLAVADSRTADGGPPPMSIEAFDRNDGTRRWIRSELDQTLIADGRVLVVVGDHLYGLDPATGERSWVVELPAADPTTGEHQHHRFVQPAFGGERVSVVEGPALHGSPTTLLLDSRTGRRIAELEGRPITGAQGPSSLPLVLERTPEGADRQAARRLLAVDAQGDTVWEQQLERPEVDGGRPSTRHMTVHDELLLFASGWQHGEQVVQLVDLASGRLVHEGLWEFDEPVRPLGEDVVEVVRDDVQIAVSVVDGTELWRLDGGPLPLGRPAADLLVRVGSDLVALHVDPRNPGPGRPGGGAAWTS